VLEGFRGSNVAFVTVLEMPVKTRPS